MGKLLTRDLDGTSKIDDLFESGFLRWVVFIIGIILVLFHLYTSVFGVLTAMLQRAVHLMFVLTLVFLTCPSKSNGGQKKIHWFDCMLLILGIFITSYIIINYQELVWRAGRNTTLDLIVAFIGVLVVLEATRRTTGLILPSVAVIFLLYAFYGRYMPGLLAHRGYSIERVFTWIYLYSEGIFGAPLGVSATFIVMFIIFGAILLAVRGGDFFIDLCSAFLGQTQGGPAKVAVVASSLFGTISGSSIANVVATGSITIPLMKKMGYPPHFAAAVEAVASSGGQIMPPIMGAAAFVMSEMTGIPYVYILIRAIIPALLYYLCVFLSVHFESIKLGLKGIPKKDLPIIREVLIFGWHLLIPLLVIIFALVGLRWSPMRAATYGIASLLLVSSLRKNTRLTFYHLLLAMEEGAKQIVPIACACACAGIIAGVVSLTGLGLKISSAIVGLAASNLLPALFLSACAAILLGMALPTTPAYIILAVMVAPSLVMIGLKTITAHMFVFYLACFSVITPPVALASYTAAGLAGASQTKTALAATRLGFVGFIIPFMFVYGEGLLGLGTIATIFFAVVTAILGVFSLSFGLSGWLFGRLNMVMRLVLICAAFLLVFQERMTDIIGFIVLLVFVIIRYKSFLKQKLRR